MNFLQRLKPWLGRKSVRGFILIVLILLAVSFLTNNKEVDENPYAPKKPVVSLTSANEYAGEQSLSLIGNVRAFTEARITSERAGRVVSVNATLGQFVPAGTVLVTLENASEQAAVLQAEGVYESALASAAQSDVSLDEATNSFKSTKNSAVSTLKSTYNSTYNIIINSIDVFFANPKSNVPGLRIDGKGFTNELNSARVNFESILPVWQTRTNTVTTESDLVSEINYASQNVQKAVDMIDTFLIVFNQQDTTSRYSESELITFSTNFTNIRSQLISLQSSLNSAETALQSANDAVRKAELSTVGGTNSAADAQVKQALGSLRAAQANLAKTILRTPVSGTVNSIDVRTGDFVNSFSPVAVVANNSALEVVVYIGDAERNFINEGDEVIIEQKYKGVVTQIAPAVDSTTRKTEVRIATEGEGIANGDTVRVTKESKVSDSSVFVTQVPLTAIKFDRENGSVFLVEENKLVSRPVKLGKIRGNSVEILEGIAASDEFVVDARGLIDGEEIIVKE